MALERELITPATHLHSNMVKFKYYNHSETNDDGSDLHSNMVKFK